MTISLVKEVKERPLGRMLGEVLASLKAFRLVILISTLCGCATKEPSSAPQPGNGIQEYHQLTKQAVTLVHATLDSLELISARTNSCPPKIVEAFEKQLQRLQIESIQVRARVQAIQARGDAYFENWSENLARMKDAQIRELAARFHPKLKESFMQIKLASQNAREAFRDFSSGLRKLRVSLENDPSVIRTEATKELIRTTRDTGQQVLQQLSAVNVELQAMTQMLTPANSAPTR